MRLAPFPACGYYEEGFEPVAKCFAEHLANKIELGACFAAYHQGRLVVDLWGGLADITTKKPWTRDTTGVVFSVTKGLTAIALHLLADEGKLDWDAPVSSVWPNFAKAGKSKINFRTLFNHAGGLVGLDTPLTLQDCISPNRKETLLLAIENQRPYWVPGTMQAYHAHTYGMYAKEVFERIAGEPAGQYLRKHYLDPLGAEAWIGTPPEEDHRVSTLVPPSTALRIARLAREAIKGGTIEARVARDSFSPKSITRAAFLNPSTGPEGMKAYCHPEVWRHELLWASATANARGLARAYLPFAQGGVADGKRYFKAETIEPLTRRQSWSQQDRVIQKPMGWSQGFMKEEVGVFTPHQESFGHPGMGGSMGWCDPVVGLSFGYVTNLPDWKIRSPRALALTRSLYECEPIKQLK